MLAWWRLPSHLFGVSSLGGEWRQALWLRLLYSCIELHHLGLQWHNRASCSLIHEALVQVIMKVNIFTQILSRPETVGPKLHSEWRRVSNKGGFSFSFISNWFVRVHAHARSQVFAVVGAGKTTNMAGCELLWSLSGLRGLYFDSTTWLLASGWKYF